MSRGPKFAASILCGALLAGCGHTFKSEGEEFEYLNSISNPTPAQWERRKELREKALLKVHEEEMRRKAETDEADREWAAGEPARAKAEKERAAVERREAVADLMRRGEAYEAKGEPGPAFHCYKDVVEKYPDAPEAKLAAERKKICSKLAYGEDEK